MQDFRVLNVKTSEKNPSTHSMFMRSHRVREKIPEKPPDKTMFLIGVPPYYTEDALSKLFSKFGTVVNVYLHKNPTTQLPPTEASKFFPVNEKIKGFKVAYVVFEKEHQLDKALENEESLLLPTGVVTGTRKWLKELKTLRPDVKELQAEIDDFMNNYDSEVSKKNKQDKDAAEPDDDGWVTVTRQGRRPGTARKESVQNKLLKKSEEQMKKKGFSNFYKFQIRESKMKNLVALRQKFEEDKKKIAALKQTRRFKPF